MCAYNTFSETGRAVELARALDTGDCEDDAVEPPWDATEYERWAT